MMTSPTRDPISDSERNRLNAFNRRIIEAFGIEPADLDEVVITLRPGRPPEIQTRRRAPFVTIGELQHIIDGFDLIPRPAL